ncbi:MAG TPA: DNA topoisomerase VI subunit B [Bdellovibrionota bacterium]|nr:DNA topoisomerase VI subunit B [Bdellovibrionota bacterium]
MASKASSKQITTSSTAEYFSRNLQQVGFSSQTKAVLTTLKEAVDNALDACEEEGILPEVEVEIEKVGTGSIKNSDQIRIKVTDNGPGIGESDVTKVFGEYLASSKFGRGRCSRGQQGIGISAATTWAQLTSAQGARVVTKTKAMRKALSCLVEVDIKHNKGVMKDRETIDWDRPHGTSVEFLIDGRIQLNGDAGLINYLNGTSLVNPHLTLHFKLPEMERQTIERVATVIPEIPEATEPHPHTMKLGEFIAHSHLFGRVSAAQWLKKGFSRVNEGTIKELTSTGGIKKSMLDKSVDSLGEADFKALFVGLQNLKLMAPSTKSVLAIGEDSLSKSIRRLGAIDFFSVMTRKPTICDFKPVQIEVAIARLVERTSNEGESPVQVLRFANRVPLQFDKAACAIVHSIESVNWRAYGLTQPKDSVPVGPYIIAVSVVSPFIKFKNASKETIDGSEELVEEIRRSLIQAGQKLSKHIRREVKANELEEKIRHIEQFGPILVEGLVRISKAPASRKKKAEEGLLKLLGRDANATQKELDEAHAILEAHKAIGGTPLLNTDGEATMPDGADGEEETPAEKVAEAVKAVKGKKDGKGGKKSAAKAEKAPAAKVKTKGKSGKRDSARADGAEAAPMFASAATSDDEVRQ